MSEQAFKAFVRSPVDPTVVRRSWLAGHDGQRSCGPVDTTIWVADPRLPPRLGSALATGCSSWSGAGRLATIPVGIVLLVLTMTQVLWWPVSLVLAVLVTLGLLASNRVQKRFIRSVSSGGPGYAAVELVCDTMESVSIGGYRVPLGRLVWDMTSDPAGAGQIVKAVGAMAVQARRYEARVEAIRSASLDLDAGSASPETDSMRLLGAVTEALRGDNAELGGTPTQRNIAPG